MNKVKSLLAVISSIRLIPHILLFNFHKNKKIIQYDTKRWLELTGSKNSLQFGFINLMTFLPEFRNLFYKRIGIYSILINWLCPKMSTLYIITNDIGPGLFIQHGFSTRIGAASIGKDCWINQQVTIGYSNKTDRPHLGDNVTICSGAKIIGGIKMGNNSTAGANAVVVKDVPDNCTVVGVPAYIVRRNGIKVKEEL
jgi:serine O-acetyltransferase